MVTCQPGPQIIWSGASIADKAIYKTKKEIMSAKVIFIDFFVVYLDKYESPINDGKNRSIVFQILSESQYGGREMGSPLRYPGHVHNISILAERSSRGTIKLINAPDAS